MVDIKKLKSVYIVLGFVLIAIFAINMYFANEIGFGLIQCYNETNIYYSSTPIWNFSIIGIVITIVLLILLAIGKSE